MSASGRKDISAMQEPSPSTIVDIKSSNGSAFPIGGPAAAALGLPATSPVRSCRVINGGPSGGSNCGTCNDNTLTCGGPSQPFRACVQDVATIPGAFSCLCTRGASCLVDQTSCSTGHTCEPGRAHDSAGSLGTCMCNDGVVCPGEELGSGRGVCTR
jgi:hypothetical protein